MQVYVLRYSIRSICYFFTFLFLAGCEAPLTLEGVEKRKSYAVLPFDHFQAATSLGDSLFVVGSQGVIVSSDDMGKTWSREVLPGEPALIDVLTCPDGTTVVLAFDKNIWLADAQDGTWKAKQIDTEEVPQAATCDSRNRVWVVSTFGSINVSDDYGDSWSDLGLGEDTTLTKIQFIDAQNAVICAEFGMLIKSDNGGEDWTVEMSLPDEFYPQSCYFETTEKGWVVGLQGKIWMTEDGGATWAIEDAGVDAPLYGINFDGLKLIAVGEAGVVLHRTDSGWKKLPHNLPVRSYLRSVLPLNGKEILVAGGSGALHTLALD